MQFNANDYDGEKKSIGNYYARGDEQRNLILNDELYALFVE